MKSSILLVMILWAYLPFVKYFDAVCGDVFLAKRLHIFQKFATA